MFYVDIDVSLCTFFSYGVWTLVTQTSRVIGSQDGAIESSQVTIMKKPQKLIFKIHIICRFAAIQLVNLQQAILVIMFLNTEKKKKILVGFYVHSNKFFYLK